MSQETEIPQRPARQALVDWKHYSLLAVFLAFLGQAAGASSTQALSTVYVFIQEELGLSRGQVGLLTSSIFAAGSITAFLAGWAVDRYPLRVLFPLTLGCMGGAFFLFGLGANFFYFLSITALMGALLPVNNPAATRFVIEWAPLRMRGMAMGLKQASVPTTGAISAAILPALAVTLGWRPVLFIVGAVIVVSALTLFAGYRDRTDHGGKARERHSMKSGLRQVALDPRVLAACLVFIIGIGLYFVTITYLMLFLIDTLGFTATAAGFGLAAFQVASIAGRISWGVISDTLMKGRRLPVLMIIFLLSTFFLGSHAFVDTETPLWVVWALVLGLGFTVASFQGVYHTHVAEVVGPSLMGTAMGFIGTVSRIGPVAIPPTFGYIVDASGGDYSTAWLMAAGLALFMVFSLVFMGRTTKRSKSDLWSG
ncbi:MAG: MFS transporter [Dehalococcoidia bacterium]